MFLFPSLFTILWEKTDPLDLKEERGRGKTAPDLPPCLGKYKRGEHLQSPFSVCYKEWHTPWSILPGWRFSPPTPPPTACHHRLTHTHTIPLSVYVITICWMFTACKEGETRYKRVVYTLRTFFSKEVKRGGSGRRAETAQSSTAAVTTPDSLLEKKQNTQSISPDSWRFHFGFQFRSSPPELLFLRLNG